MEDGEVRYLAAEWDGTAVPVPAEGGAPYRGEGSAVYSALLRRLADLPGGGPVVLARGEMGKGGSLNLLVLLGGLE